MTFAKGKLWDRQKYPEPKQALFNLPSEYHDHHVYQACFGRLNCPPSALVRDREPSLSFKVMSPMLRRFSLDYPFACRRVDSAHGTTYVALGNTPRQLLRLDVNQPTEAHPNWDNGHRTERKDCLCL